MRGSDVEQHGQITFNGDSLDSGRFSPQLVTEFVDQMDINSSLLTVR